MENLYFNTMLITGAKGDIGDMGIIDAIPVDTVLPFDGDIIPEGYEETTDPTQ